MDLRLEPRHLCREAEQLHPVLRRRLVLETVERFLAQALQEAIEFARDLPHQILGLVGGLEGGAPDLAPAGLAEIGEIFGETGNEIGLGEQSVDREAHLQPLMQFKQTHPDGICMKREFLLRQRQNVFQTDCDENTVDRLARPILFQDVQKRQPAFLVGLAV
ncbi:hypothetical protein ACVWY2_002248 [Bradyrhizobium sp. JR6.1]